MGYLTSHKLSIIKGVNPDVDYETEIIEASGHCASFDDSVKWYGHEKDMREYSKRHPETLFELSGEGEENEDIWREYYLNGKMQSCKAVITYEPFNESKLK